MRRDSAVLNLASGFFRGADGSDLFIVLFGILSFWIVGPVAFGLLDIAFGILLDLAGCCFLDLAYCLLPFWIFRLLAFVSTVRPPPAARSGLALSGPAHPAPQAPLGSLCIRQHSHRCSRSHCPGSLSTAWSVAVRLCGAQPRSACRERPVSGATASASVSRRVRATDPFSRSRGRSA